MTQFEESTHSSTANTPLQEHPSGGHPIYLFFAASSCSFKNKRKEMHFHPVHVSEALVLQMGDFIYQRSQNPTCSPAQNKFY